MQKSVWFPALLKSVEGEVLACGAANVIPETGDINFRSDFVPLFPMGEVLMIVRLDEDNEIANYTGKVYISNRKLMRLVSVGREIVAGENYVFRDLPFKGTLKPLCEESPPTRKFLKLKSKAADQEDRTYEVDIIGLGQHCLVFQYDVDTPFYRDQRFLVKTDLPIDLPETEIEIEEAFIFGTKSSYRCRLQKLADEDCKRLMQFLMLYGIP